VEQALPASNPNTWDCEIPQWNLASEFAYPFQGGDSLLDPAQPDLFGWDPNRGPRLPFGTLRLLCRRVIGEFGPIDWEALKPKHGPGAVAEKGWISKYEFPSWPRKLGLWFPFEWYGSGDVSSEYIPPDREPYSRLIAVPKTSKGPRLICSEPIAHQWMQQSIFRWLNSRIKATTLGRCISFEDQEASRKLALQASHDRSYATLDLSEASDRLSTRLVEHVFQGHESLLNSMHACRTRALEQKLVGDLSRVTLLRKFSTMGSALTFPVQSIVFAILSIWALRLSEGRQDDWRNWRADFDRVRVYGDDIIVPIGAYGLTKSVLHACGLKVNTRKSFGGTSFRESCGMDAFRGVDVTPARYRKPYSGSASSTAALIEFSNNLYIRGFWRTSDKVLGFLPDKVRKNLVVSGPKEGSLGLFSFAGNDFDQRKLYWDRDLQRNYVKRLSFYAKIRKTQGRGSSSLIQFFTEDPASQRDRLIDVPMWSSGRTTTDRIIMKRSRVYL